MVFAQSELSFLKTVRNQYNKATARQWNPRTPRIAENIDAVNDLALGQDGAPGTHKTTRQIARETAFCRGQWDASYTKTSIQRQRHPV